MEKVGTNLPNGSYAQRVQAEYLKEAEDRGDIYKAKEASLSDYCQLLPLLTTLPKPVYAFHPTQHLQYSR